MEKTVPGTTITESSMQRMLRHNREITGQTHPMQQPDEPHVNHEQIAENIRRSAPVLLPGVARPRVNATRVTEGVQGTSPTPGQDNIAYMPPTTSNVTNPGHDGKGPDAENEPATKPPTKAEQMARDLATLFGEAKDPEEDDPDEDDDDDNNEKDKDGKDKKGKKDKDKDDDKEDMDEAVEVHCESCGYEETYDLSEASIKEGNVPLNPEGQLDSKCPMCGADMDLSMVGATNVAAVGDPRPFTDLQGNSPQQRESVVPTEAIAYANDCMIRIARGESLENVVRGVVESDFINYKRERRSLTTA